MYYEPGKSHHGLKHDPFKSCVVPRPIGWISTLDAAGVPNLAPYSQFQNVTFDPPIVMFAANQNSSGNRKDTVHNAEQTGEFVWNMCSWDLREAMNISAQELPPGVNEIEAAGLETVSSTLVKPPRIKKSPIQFECKYLNTLRFPGNGVMGSADVVFGRVVGIHIADEFIDENGLVDILKIRPIARMGYFEYTSVDSKFSMAIPGDNRALLGGLEGSPDKVHQVLGDLN
jgi:flavin reductase (DIM6/NTAB) family NADH-FMN oxidoreductase RutF